MAKINTVFGLTDNVSSNIRKIATNVKNATGNFESFSGKLIAVNSGLDLLGKALNLVKQAGSFIGGFVSDAGEYESLLVRLTVATGDAVTAQEEFQKLKDFAKTSPFDLPGVVQASIMFRNAGIEADKLIPTIQMLGDVAQGNNDYFNRMALNFMQIKSAGKATMQDLNQFAYMGVPIKQVLKDMGVTGVATADDIERAFKIMTSAGGQFYNSMSSNANTMSGKTSNMRDAIQQLSAEIGNLFLPIVKKMTGAIGEFVTNVMELDSVKKVFDGIRDKISNLQNQIGSIIATLIYLGTIATIVGAIMATAWAVANWPITVTIIVLASVLTMFYEVVNGANQASIAVNGFGNQIASAGKMFGTVIGFIVGVIGSVVTVVTNVLKTFSNIILTMREFVINFFVSPFDAIKGLFLNLASTVIDILSTLAGPFDFIFGTNIDETLNKASRKIQEFKMNSVGDGYITTTAGTGGTFDLNGVDSLMETITQTGNLAGDIGAELDKALAEMPPIPEMPPPPEPQEFNFDSSGALIVNDKNIVNLADDFKALLSEQATKRFNLQFSQVTPSVNVGDIVVNSNADYDRIVEAIVNSAEQAQSSSLRS